VNFYERSDFRDRGGGDDGPGEYEISVQEHLNPAAQTSLAIADEPAFE
jgi:hypothetical protein